MVLQKTDATTLTWATNNIQKYYYDISTGVESFDNTGNFELVIYPNPSNGRFYINYQNNNRSNIEISISDITGKTIDIIAKGNFEKGKQSFYYQNSNLSKGIYLVKIYSDNNIKTKKIIILK